MIESKKLGKVVAATLAAIAFALIPGSAIITLAVLGTSKLIKKYANHS